MSILPQRKLKIFFHPVDAVGHFNACIGLGQELQRRGHQISFLTDQSLKGQFDKFGFKEILLVSTPFGGPKNDGSNKEENDSTENHGQQSDHPLNDIIDHLQTMVESGLLSNKTSLEKCKLFDKNEFFEGILVKCIEFNDQIEKHIQSEKPDLFIVDNFMVEPCITHSGIPWILMFSGNPIWMFQSKELPPFASGYATNGDKESWVEYQQCLEENFLSQMLDRQNRLLKHFNYPERKTENRTLSPYLNIYGYPEELDYHDAVPRPDKFVSVDAFCRKMPKPFQLLNEFRNKIQPGDKLVYVSLGSMGSANVALMKRMVDILSRTPHKYIVSKGALHDKYQLGDNMWGEAFVPQTDILPLVDLVITHGGNNTVTESFSFGKPMIVMPLFGDQWDNAQRIHEKKLGIRLHTHEYTEQELVDSVNQLLNDTKLNQKLRAISQRIQQSNSKENACIAIEQMVENNNK